MMETEATTCFHHPERVTGRSCTRCHRPACPECLHAAAVGSHCWECIKAAGPSTTQRIHQGSANSTVSATKAIIAVNVVILLLVLVGSPGIGRLGLLRDIRGQLALSAPGVQAGQWYRLLTSGFMHFGVLHILFNMLILYRFGMMLEPVLGRFRLVALYLAALLTGSLGALLFSPYALTAGASGAVFGLVGAAAVGLRQRGIDVWRSGVGPMLAFSLVFTFVVPGISIGGHLGGLAGGLIVGSVMLREPQTRRTALEGMAVAGLVSVVAMVGAVVAASRF